MGVADHRVRDAAHQGAAYAAEATAAHNNEAGPHVLCDLDDLIRAMPFCYPQVLLGDLAPILLDLLDLIFEDLLRLLPQLFYDLGLADVVGRIAGSNRDNVQLRVRALGQIHGGATGQLSVPGAIGGQKDLGRENAHLLTPSSRR